jgi:uncharacterized protein
VSAADRETDRTLAVAPYWHSAIFLLIIAGTVRLGYLAQHRAVAGPGLSSEHVGVVKIYLGAAIADWLLFWFVWWGVSLKQVSLRELIVFRWNSLRRIATDIALSIPFWFLWEAAARWIHTLLGPNQAKTVDVLLPRSTAEIAAWIFVSITAGITEETVFRGYVQRQLLAISSSTVAAVIGQGILFGLAHAYQGWKNVAVIAVLGMLYGAFAAWRKTLLPVMLVHAFTDVYEGWAKFVIFR